MIVVKKLVWDAWNIAHIARHDVLPEEVEQVCTNRHITLKTYSHRYLVAGHTDQGRVISVILTPKGSGVYYPITARSASRKERRIYQEHIGDKIA